MDETAHARAAFREGLADITPGALRDHLEEVLEDASLTPGALTVATATALDGAVDRDLAARRGAGVQMSYEGLRLSRSLIRTTPWEHGDRESGDLDVIAAEVLVARGFEYLAHTGVALDVVEAVQQFGRTQTLREAPDCEAVPATRLEADFVRIAVEAGADVALESTPQEVTALAEALAEEFSADPLPTPDVVLADADRRLERLALSHDRPTAGDVSGSSET
ncbi:uncharacterized protein NP_3832A [Natronomonas pharaonis DSM 2160]|uniref:Uncharacterized protein n=1 Tax=Natronomonas pharaonis (strain ATCC 35678 / DSM 2160 / CIP 103997 / JCM 8858 / NBRC 14720 / NCIMB 2260 / Gabara) TaxID=348780 RepID=A0A1U7EXT2_NATPD|nr:hypothetical protein [Natronomonas pharaonis]CAI50007.1 uncharacterized protein NP_3832A [Natronomonas pharaonis DSM 2160]